MMNGANTKRNEHDKHHAHVLYATVFLSNGSEHHVIFFSFNLNVFLCVHRLESRLGSNYYLAPPPLCFQTSPAPSTITPFAPTPPAEQSCCAACVFDLVFHWLSSCQGQGLHLGAPAVTQCLVGCHSAPLALCCSQSFPQQRGQPLIPPCPISDSVGLQTHLITSPLSPLWSANFLIHACKLYIFSSVKAEMQSLWGIYFFHSWDLVFCDWVLCPQVFFFLSKRGKRNRDNRTLIVCMNSCMRILLGKPNRNQMCSLPHATCGGLLDLIYISVNLWPHIFPFLCIPVMFSDN